MDLTWQQDKSNKLIISINNTDQVKQFLLTDSLVGYLAVHKLVHIFIALEGSDEQSTLVNFAGIRPLSGEIKNFGGKQLTEDVRREILRDKCAIARGDTFASKWLTPKGWSTEKHYFALEPVPSEKKTAKVTCPSCNKQIPKNSKFCGYCGKSMELKAQRLCINNECKKIIRDNARFCPYCGIKQQ